MKKVLIVDDNSNIIRALYRLLQPEGYDLFSASHPLDALSMLGSEQVDLVLSDQRMPEMEGIELLLKAQALQPNCARVLMSSFRDFEDLVVAFNSGVIQHFVQKPWNNQALKLLLRSFLKPARRKITSQNESEIRPHNLITSSPKMLAVLDKIELLRDQSAPVFIYGETGTGKELVAKSVHEVSSYRDGQFIAINGSNLTPELLESQLFGHKKGAFTGAIQDQPGLLQKADGGTLFLDEITDLPHIIQCKLLRVLQEREYTSVGDTEPRSFDCQIISASSTRMEDAVARGLFRADLMYRLDVFPLNLPPLRERTEDILTLFIHFSGCTLNQNAAQTLLSYSWPGNVRELQNTATYAQTYSPDGTVNPDHLPYRIKTQAHTLLPATQYPPAINQQAIELALEQANHNKSAAARSLGMSRMTLWRHMTRLGMTQPTPLAAKEYLKP
jgi:DNA-binding NtrC family response regulator